MKKYLLMMTLALLGGVTQVKAWNYLQGTFNGWAESPAYCLDKGPVAVYLEANTNYEFKIVASGSWLGKTSTTITETTTINGFSDADNITLTTSAAGYYVFSIDWGEGLALTVRYPDTMVYFYNALNWSNVYLHDGWWNGDNGACNKNALRGVEMTAGDNNIYYAYIPKKSLYRVTFTSDKQVDYSDDIENGYGAGYGNFYGTDVVWNADEFDSSKPLYVPINTLNETLNTSANYYYGGTWHAYPSYTRSELTAGNFGTICLPFAATVTGATVFIIVSKVMSGETLTGINLESVDALEAGKAYIFKATGSTLTATYSGSYADASADFGMMGNLSASPVTVAQGNYVVNSNKLRKVTGDAVTVGQYKAYVTLDGISEAASRSSDFISFNEGTTTGIETVSDSQIKTNETYDLQGRRVNATNRQKGLYIVNGKKYIVK